MDIRWVKNLSGKAKEKRIEEVKAYKNAFDAILEVLETEFETAATDYTVASWSHQQADVNGANRKLKSIISLLKL